MMNTGRMLICGLSLAVALPSVAGAGCVAPAGASGSNPDKRYVISLNNQEVYDSETDITWQRCPYGWFVTPQGNACVQMQGGAGLWSQRPGKGTDLPELYLHHIGPPDWRAHGWVIPAKKDLYSLVDHVCKNPAINQTVFPNTPPGMFWSSSSKGNNSHGHEFFYVVSFAGDGSTDDHEDANSWPIRLMHKGKTDAIVFTLQKRPVASQ